MMQSNISEPRHVTSVYRQVNNISAQDREQLLDNVRKGKKNVYPDHDQIVNLNVSPVFVIAGRKGGPVHVRGSSSEVVREIVADKATGLVAVEVAPPTAPPTDARTSVAETTAATKDDLSTCGKVIVCLFFLLLCTLLMLLYVWWKNDMSIPNLWGRSSGRSRSDRCFDPFPEPLRPCVGEPKRVVPVKERSTWTATIVGGVAIVAPLLAPFFWLA